MASKRAIRRRECGHKKRYENQTLAVKQLINLKRKDNDRMRSYRCRFCGGWHVGHC